MYFVGIKVKEGCEERFTILRIRRPKVKLNPRVDTSELDISRGLVEVSRTLGNESS